MYETPVHCNNDNHTWNNTNINLFGLSIARPKLDFPIFNGDNPTGWLCQCEKYFLLANVPMDI